MSIFRAYSSLISWYLYFPWCSNSFWFHYDYLSIWLILFFLPVDGNLSVHHPEQFAICSLKCFEKTSFRSRKSRISSPCCTRVSFLSFWCFNYAASCNAGILDGVYMACMKFANSRGIRFSHFIILILIQINEAFCCLRLAFIYLM